MRWDVLLRHGGFFEKRSELLAIRWTFHRRVEEGLFNIWWCFFCRTDRIVFATIIAVNANVLCLANVDNV